MTPNLSSAAASAPVKPSWFAAMPPGEALAWLGLLAVCACSMVVRPVLSGALTGTALAQLSPPEVLVFLIAAWRLSLRRPGARPATSFDRWMAGFAIALTVSFLYGIAAPPTDDYSSGVASVLYRTVLVATAGGYFLARGVAGTRTHAFALVCVLAAVGAAIAWAIISGGVQNSDPRLEATGAVYGTIELPLSAHVQFGGNTGALYLMPFFYLCVAAVIAAPWWPAQILCGLAAALFGSALLALATRGVLIAIPFGCAAMLILSWRRASGQRQQTGRHAWALVLAAAVAVFVHANFQRFTASMGEFQEQKLSVLTDRDTPVMPAATLVARLDQYEYYAATALRNPLGYGMMTEYPFRLGQPHSLILKLMMMSGWLGLATYLAALIGMTRFWFERLPHVAESSRPFLLGMIATNATLLALSWGYDIFLRFGILLTHSLLCGLTTAIALSRTPAGAPPAATAHRPALRRRIR